jgi:hypothetical protein
LALDEQRQKYRQMINEKREKRIPDVCHCAVPFLLRFTLRSPTDRRSKRASSCCSAANRALCAAEEKLYMSCIALSKWDGETKKFYL